MTVLHYLNDVLPGEKGPGFGGETWIPNAVGADGGAAEAAGMVGVAAAGGHAALPNSGAGLTDGGTAGVTAGGATEGIAGTRSSMSGMNSLTQYMATTLIW